MNNFDKGLQYYEKRDYARAVKFLEKAVKELPVSATWLNLSAAYYGANMIQDGGKSAKKALELNPDDFKARNNVALAHHKLNQPELALENFKKAGDAGFVDGYFNYSIARLKIACTFNRAEDWEDGWTMYESRFSRERPVKLSYIRPGTPRWTGNEKGRVLVLAEQGVGDCIQFSRYVPFMQRIRGVEPILQHFPDVEDLFKGSGIELITHSDTKYDYWVPICSLAGIFKFVNGAPYMQAKPFVQSNTGLIQKPRIGLCWKGSDWHVNDHNRSSTKEKFLHNFSSKDYEIVSCQFKDNPLIKSWQDTLDIVNSCDIIVTVDTSIAHVAGAMGKPTIVLLPVYDVDWRWGRFAKELLHPLGVGEISRWYDSIVLIRDMDFHKAKQALKLLLSKVTNERMS